MSDGMAHDLRLAWHAFVDVLTPHRSVLHAYCRRLTGNLWDAEDLVQSTLLRAFGQWGVANPPIRDPRAYVIQTATHLWIDTTRHRQAEIRALALEANEPASAGSMEGSSEVREAGARLMRTLSPQERAALVLKEVFGMTNGEIALLLATTEGAIKAALHRGRERLDAPPSSSTHRPAASPALLDQFIERFAERDVDGLLALMLDGAVAENVGNSTHAGRDAAGLPHFIDKLVHGHAEWPAETQYESSRLARATVEDEQVLLLFVTRRGREALMSVLRLEECDGLVSRVRSYGFCPETIRAVGALLGVHVFTGLYRAPSPIGDP